MDLSYIDEMFAKFSAKYPTSSNKEYVHTYMSKIRELISCHSLDIKLTKILKNSDNKVYFELEAPCFVMNTEAFEIFREIFLKTEFHFDESESGDKVKITIIPFHFERKDKFYKMREYGYGNNLFMKSFPEYISYFIIQIRGVRFSSYNNVGLDEFIYDVFIPKKCFERIKNHLFRLARMSEAFTLMKTQNDDFYVQFCVKTSQMNNAYERVKDDIIFWHDT